MFRGVFHDRDRQESRFACRWPAGHQRRLQRRAHRQSPQRGERRQPERGDLHRGPMASRPQAGHRRRSLTTRAELRAPAPENGPEVAYQPFTGAASGAVFILLY